MISISSPQKKTETLCNALRYTDSRFFTRFDASWEGVDKSFVHLYERAVESCNLKGVYSCQPLDRSTDSVPIVYVCEAETEEQARKIHKQVWNQNVVPFLLVVSPDTVRLYNGFGFDQNKQNPLKDIPWGEIESQLSFLNRQSLDTGEVWQSPEWHNRQFQASKRLNLHLLENLKNLGRILIENGLGQDSAHGLIVKYIYLQYMRHRGFLSDERLTKWEIEPLDIFTRNATLTAFNRLDAVLHEELNGSVFPIPSKSKVKQQHLERVAAVFYGDDAETEQQTIFQLYDFSFIPTELLATVYENFLHVTERGRAEGAYYTPLPLVNFVLNELDRKKTLTKEMTIMDPACGSGAFLVQSYRRLIRKAYPEGDYKPDGIKALLTDHIFGIDTNQNACRVAQLGLLLTLLDHLQPPSLFGNKKFRLPDLDKNIVQADVFDLSIRQLNDFEAKKFDWIIGNPPWKVLGKTSLAAKWCGAKPNERPTSDSLAEAFVWRSLEFAKNDSALGLLLPAMTLFNTKREKHQFRQRFFSVCDVWTITNFSNVRKMLFHGAAAPCAAFFFRPVAPISLDTSILTYAPIRADQAIIRREGHKNSGSWNVIVNASDIRNVPISEARTGDPLVWKTAMWGAYRDLQLLRRVAKKFSDFDSFARQHGIRIHEGPQLRINDGSESVEEISEVNRKDRLVMERLKNCGQIFVFPKSALEKIPKERCFVRKGRKDTPLSICRPPHIVIDAARRFAVFSDQFILVPPRQLGIAYEKDTSSCPLVLKALSLYLNSHFFKYHQFFNTSQWGVKIDVTALKTLLCLPVPLDSIDKDEMRQWSIIYDELQNNARSGFCSETETQKKLLEKANRRINKVLGLRPTEILLIDDFLNYRMKFVDGRVPNDLLEPASEKQLASYAEQLGDELNCFFDDGDEIYHEVSPVCIDGPMGAVRINIFLSSHELKKSTVQIAIPNTVLDVLRLQHSQWLYFSRNLRIFDKNSIYLFKPKECYHWTKSQALLDADNILADILAMEGGGK